MTKANDIPQFTEEQARVLRALADSVLALTKPATTKAAKPPKKTVQQQVEERLHGMADEAKSGPRVQAPKVSGTRSSQRPSGTG